jgi:DNA invertase Pin-like site-specific DNA recombinase
VDLFLHQQGIDTSTIAGKFQMLSVFAEFERGIIRVRVNAGWRGHVKTARSLADEG